jgi:AcrR family transcriptional regulator
VASNKKVPGIPAPKQERSKATIDQVLAIASSVLSEYGESRVRVQEISAETGVSIGSIYHHFGNREGLILAAYVDTYAKGMREDLNSLVTLLDSVTSLNDLIQLRPKLRELTNSHFSKHSAMSRIAILGGSAGRDNLKAMLTKEQTRLLIRFTESIERLRQLGYLKPELTAHGIAVMILGMILGRAVSEIDAEPLADEAWNDVLIEMLNGLLNPATAAQVALLSGAQLLRPGKRGK